MYYKTPIRRGFNNLLPSVNLRYELDKDMIARFGASRTIGRQNYNVLGTGFGTPTCDASGCSVTGPNPDLKPLTSDHIDVSWAWYFQPRALVSVDLFHSKIDGYVKTGTASRTTVDLQDPRDQTIKPFFGAASASSRTSAAPRRASTPAVRWSARPNGPPTWEATSRTMR